MPEDNRPKQKKLVPRSPHHRFTLCVSGAARGATVKKDYSLAFALGEEIARQGHILVSGATIGLPDWAAQGAKAAGGMSIGISPAASYKEHVKKYRLPTEAYDFILYSGLHYVGRDALLVQSSDAVFSIGGRMGTVHEFATAFESHIPVGVLEDSGGTSADFQHLMEAANLCHGEICDGAHDIYFSDSTEELVSRIVKLLEKRHDGANIKA